MKVAAAYIRVSTDDQLEYSPDSQVNELYRFAKQHDMLIPQEYIFREEDGVSGRTAAKRPEFQRMIGTAKQKPVPFEVILVWKFSRFARNQEESIVYKSLLRKQCNVEVVSVSEPISDNPFGGLIERIIEWMDEYYSTRLAGEVKRGMTEKANRGEPVSIASYGYRMVNKKLVVVPEQAETVRMVFEQFSSGSGTREIAIRLNMMGLRTNRGNRWENRTIEYMLHNTSYIGKVRWNPTGLTHYDYNSENLIVSDGEHEHIITDEMWKQTQNRMEVLKQMYPSHAKKDSPPAGDFMLRGLVKCSSCGATLARSTKDSVQCNAYARGRCHVSHHISLNQLNAIVVCAIEGAVNSGDFVLTRRDSPKAVDARKVAEKQLEYANKKLLRVREAYAEGIDTLEEYQQNKSRIQAEIDRITDTIPPLLENPETLKKDFIAMHHATPATLRDVEVSEEDKNKLLRTFVDKIVFDRATTSVQIFFYI